MTALADVPAPRREVHAPKRGTVLEVARGGLRGGRAVVVHHDARAGGPTVSTVLHAAAVGHGLELLLPARPGFGRSDPFALGSISVWPALLLPVLERLGFDEQVGVVGLGQGAPYALAVAAALPDRVERVALLGDPGGDLDPDHGIAWGFDVDDVRQPVRRWPVPDGHDADLALASETLAWLAAG